MTPNLGTWLKRLEELERGATVGPLQVDAGNCVVTSGDRLTPHGMMKVQIAECDLTKQGGRDAEFIAESRNSFKQLLQIVRIQREALKYIGGTSYAGASCVARDALAEIDGMVK